MNILRHRHTLLSSCLLAIFSFGSVNLHAKKSEETYRKATELYRTGHYREAVPYLEALAQKGDKAAMYRLAHLYEEGLGVEQDYKKAAYWYKQAARSYAYTVENQKRELDIHSDAFTDRLKAQFSDESTVTAHEEALAKLDTDTPETKTFLEKVADGYFFGLEPYKTNYILPFSYSARAYTRQPSGYKSFALYDAIYGTDLESRYGRYEQHMEAEFQISLKKNLTYNLLGLGEYITIAYTQHSFWQVYSKKQSAPFRETNYMPELFMVFPTSDKIDRLSGLKATKWGYIHQSNGQDGYRSRSWNRLYVQGNFQWGNLFLSPRLWYRIKEDKKDDDFYRGYIDKNGDGKPDAGDELVDPFKDSKGDDNPDIEDYLGYGDIAFTYLWGQHHFGGLFRYNFGMGGHDRGAVELNWSYPFFGSHTTFWYFKFFNGYGESLIDYNRNNTKTSLGFAFTRGLFQ